MLLTIKMSSLFRCCLSMHGCVYRFGKNSSLVCILERTPFSQLKTAALPLHGTFWTWISNRSKSVSIVHVDEICYAHIFQLPKI